MMKLQSAVLLLVIAPLAVGACGAASTPAPTEAPAPTVGPTLAAASLPVTDFAGLEAHLAARGVAAKFEVEQDLGYLGTPGRIYDLGGGETLEVHTYPDALAAAQMAAGVAPDGASVTDANGERIAVVWMGTPHVFRSGPLIAVYVGNTPATLGTMVEAMGQPFAGGGARKQ
jgi:hypothetical protein